MKSFLVIGMGRSGQHLAYSLMEFGNDVMIVDHDAEIIENLSQDFTDAQIGDCRNEAVLKAIGVNNFNACFVTIGENFQSSLEITSLLKELGAKKVVSKASSDIQEKFLLRNGADSVFYPEREAAQKLAVLYNTEKVFSFSALSEDYSIFEVPIPKNWIGHTVVGLDVRKQYNVNIVAIKSADETIRITSGDYVFDSKDHIFILARPDEVGKFTSKL